MERIKKLPKGVKLSPDLLERCEEYLLVTYLGYKYYIPLTPDVAVILFCQRLKRGADQRAEKAIRDIISALYLQLRDVGFSDTARNVRSDLLELLSQKLTPGVIQYVEGKFGEREQQLLLSAPVVSSVQEDSFLRWHHLHHAI